MLPSVSRQVRQQSASVADSAFLYPRDFLLFFRTSACVCLNPARIQGAAVEFVSSLKSVHAYPFPTSARFVCRMRVIVLYSSAFSERAVCPPQTVRTKNLPPEPDIFSPQPCRNIKNFYRDTIHRELLGSRNRGVRPRIEKVVDKEEGR